MGKIWKHHSLTIVLLGLFLISVCGQFISGWKVENEELARHGEAALALGGYLANAQFLSSVFENWESEFLQMSAYVVLTGILIQKGSAESKDPTAPNRDSGLKQKALRRGAPHILRQGRLARALYAHSLGIVLFLLFIASFALHWLSSARNAASEALQHGQAEPGLVAYLGNPQLWFESFQNWQSEFLSTAVLVVLSIFLRHRESPESKPVAAPHSKTGS